MAVPAFTKLQLKDQREIVVLDAPASFEKELASLKGVTVHREPKTGITFALAFATTLDEVARFAKSVAARADGDAAIWVAYPKGSSKRYESEIGRDASWKALGDIGYEGVRLVANRRGLERAALPPRRVHLEHEARPEARDVQGGQSEDGEDHQTRPLNRGELGGESMVRTFGSGLLAAVFLQLYYRWRARRDKRQRSP